MPLADGGTAVAIVMALLSLLAFVGLWLFVGALSASLGGWAAMARVYRADRRPPGKVFRGESGTFGWVNYGGVLTVGVSEAGLYLSVAFLFRFRHPPLLIPWEDIHDPQARRSLFFWRIVEFSVGSPTTARISLRQRVFDAAGELVERGKETMPDEAGAGCESGPT